MPQWQGKSRGNTLGLRIFVFILSRFGVQPAYLLLRFVALYFWFFSWSSSRHIYHYFRNHGFGKLKSVFKVYSNYYVFGQTLIDKVVVMAAIENKFTYDFDGEAYLHQMVTEGKGGILISAHVGNWEAAGFLLKRLNTSVNVVMFEAEHERIKDYIQGVTGGRNFKVIPLKQDMSHVYAISEALHNNELVCLHADRFLDGNKTFDTLFLNKRALFPEGPFQLAAGFNVPVSIVFAFKDSSRHYRFFGSEPLQKQGEESKTDLSVRLRTSFVLALEEKVKRYPNQWFNYYNFWLE